MSTIEIKKVSWQDCGSELMDVRREVFIVEQDVPEHEEIDSRDPMCTHFLARDESGAPVGTARLVSGGQIGRMAVKKSQRGTGLGAKLLAAAVEYALEHQYESIFLHAQTHAIGFYESCGFTADGPEFMDAGIPHRNMSYKS